jgi:hypothetical protein
MKRKGCGTLILTELLLWLLDEVNFSIHVILLATLGPGVDSTCNRNEYQKQKNNNGLLLLLLLLLLLKW